MVPGLVYFTNLPQRRAHGTSLAATVLFASAGVAVYALEDRINLSYALIILAGSLAGVIVGTRLLQSMSTQGLQVTFAFLLGAAAVRFLIGIPEGSESISLQVVSILALVLLGVGVGMVAGLLGIGGGILIVPALVLFFETTELIAKGTSLLVVLITAATGSIRNWGYRNMDVRGALLTGCGGAFSAFGGAVLAGVVSQRLSSVFIAILMILVGVRFILSAVRTRQKALAEEHPNEAQSCAQSSERSSARPSVDQSSDQSSARPSDVQSSDQSVQQSSAQRSSERSTQQQSSERSSERSTQQSSQQSSAQRGEDTQPVENEHPPQANAGDPGGTGELELP